MLEAATEAEAEPHTPRTPTIEDLEYDLADTPRQTSDYQGTPGLGPLPEEATPPHLSRDSSVGSQVQVSNYVGPACNIASAASATSIYHVNNISNAL